MAKSLKDSWQGPGMNIKPKRFSSRYYNVSLLCFSTEAYFMTYSKRFAYILIISAFFTKFDKSQTVIQVFHLLCLMSKQ
jgi:hypothetical protein